jgi:hypothetical protein
MEEYEQVYLYLYDFYSKQQLLEIAKHNKVKVVASKRKLEIAKAIAEQTDEQFIVPKGLTPHNTLPESRVHSMSGKKRADWKKKKADMIDEQWRDVMSEEDFSKRRLKNFDRRKQNNTPIDRQEKIAVYSNRNIYWSEVGHLSKGYSFITREEAESWIRLKGVRSATPEEVASYFDL